MAEGERSSRAIRMRRLPRRWVRTRYEVDFGDGSAPRVTTTPVTLIDSILGVEAARALVAAADRGWRGGIGPWTSAPPAQTRQP